jgi:hypothetical protein
MYMANTSLECAFLGNSSESEWNIFHLICIPVLKAEEARLLAALSAEHGCTTGGKYLLGYPRFGPRSSFNPTSQEHKWHGGKIIISRIGWRRIVWIFINQKGNGFIIHCLFIEHVMHALLGYTCDVLRHVEIYPR